MKNSKTEAQAAALEPLTSLCGQVAIVTGASSGIGEAIAKALVLRGAYVTLCARRADRLRLLAERLADEGHGKTLVIPSDVRCPKDMQRLVHQTLEYWGRLDILVANAGLGYRHPIIDGDIQRWKDVLDTNIYGLLLTLKYGVRPMLERKQGHVIVTSSVAGRVVTPGGGVYCGSKFAAAAIAEALRMEVAAQGLRVTTIEPGVVTSDFYHAGEYTPDFIETTLKGAEPLAPADIARAVIFALEQPKQMGISNLVVRPTGQAYP
jgi:NADP-dependent 3-hydroxy acid dehydrogenase YdfG